MHVFDVITILILCSGVFLFVNTYFLKLPSSIGLMILALILSGLVLTIGHLFPEYQLASKVKQFDFTEVMYRFVLSVMVFAGALNVDFQKLGKQLIPVLTLSFFGVIISTLVIGTLVHFLLGFMGIELNYVAALVFGALISCTDPIAITKILRKFRVSSKLETKIAGEAWLNGGIAIILAMTLTNIYQEQLTLGTLAFDDTVLILVRDILGGVIVGILFGWVGFLVLRFIDNDVVEAEILVTLSLVMGGSYLADLLSVSPMLVAVLTGLIMGNFGRSEATGESAVGGYVYRFWHLMQESLAAMLFVLIGFEMLVVPLRIDYFSAGFFSVIIVLFARWLSVFIPIKLMSKSHSFDDATISVLTWGALRGGLPIAFTLSLSNFPGKEIIITLTYVVVVSSVLYQGLTLSPMMRLYREKQLKQKSSIKKETKEQELPYPNKLSA
jgi:CPA1 family monovalent cation:H+ antiporter